MIYPIYAYGHPVLRKECEEIEEKDAKLPEILKNMFETMYSANGVGLAAPQVGLSLRLFIVDGTRYAKDYKNSKIAVMTPANFLKMKDNRIPK